MVRLSLFFGKKTGFAGDMTDVLQWWLLVFREEVRHTIVGFDHEIV